MIYKEADKSKDNKVALDTAVGAGLGAGYGLYNYIKNRKQQQ